MTEPQLIPSILGSVKKNLNIPDSVDVFDPDLLMHINMTMAKLCQMGVGPEKPVLVEDDSTTWDEVYTGDLDAMVRTYVYLEVRLLFDPPTASVLTSMEKKRDELEWRLNVADDERLFEDEIAGEATDDDD